MNKHLSVAIIAIIIAIPTVTQAAWWNPTTWFKNVATTNIIERPVSNQESNTESELVVEDASDSSSETNIEVPQKDPSISTSNSSDEINALEREIQSLKLNAQSSQNTNTGITAVSNEQIAKNTAINEQILNTVSKLEQRISALETKTKNNDDYSKLLSRIESLEKKPVAQGEDYSVIIREIIKRVNGLLNAGDISTVGGNQTWIPIICNPGDLTTYPYDIPYEKLVEDRLRYEGSVPCRDMHKDLSY